MPDLSQTKALTAAVRSAKAAGKIIRQNLVLAKKVNAETSHDIKLELDVRCQKLIERKLRAAFPQVALLGEEGVSGSQDAESRWVVDPIDGTVNFAHEIPHASVSIALQSRISGKNGSDYETLVGVVYDPFQD